MTRDKLVKRIKWHERRCAVDPTWAFKVVEVRELTEGVLLVYCDNGTCVLFVDRSVRQIEPGTLEDTGRGIRGFPKDTIFIGGIEPGNSNSVMSAAKMCLRGVGRGRKKPWHEPPIIVEY